MKTLNTIFTNEQTNNLPVDFELGLEPVGLVAVLLVRQELAATV